MAEALLETSNQLHERVQRFAAGSSADSFEQLALDVARFQASASTGFSRLVRARGGRLESLDDIPPVPSDAFRLARVATYAAELDTVRFFTSGTTGAERGTHPMRRTDTYEQLSLAYGRQALLGPAGKAVVQPVPADERLRRFGSAGEQARGDRRRRPLCGRRPEGVSSFAAPFDRERASRAPRRPRPLPPARGLPAVLLGDVGQDPGARPRAR